MKLGPFEVEHPFILAPMAGITNSPFRRLMRRMKSAVVVSELVSANGIEYANDRTLDLLRFHEEERTVGLQIFGEDGERLAKACQKVQELGADFVDLNLGCPVPKVVKSGAGSAMCRSPSQLRVVLEQMVRSVHIPVTIKIRTGWDATSRNAIEVVKVAHDAGVAWVAIHGRTRAQGYSGEADWNFIGEVKSKSPLPIIGNGDLVTAKQAVTRMKESGVDAVLIGRGALKNPFIFEQARDLWLGNEPRVLVAEDYISLIRDQRELLEQSYTNPRSVMLHARKFLAWYSAGYPGSSDFRKMVFKTEDANALWENALEFFSLKIQGRNLKELEEPFLMGGHG